MKTVRNLILLMLVAVIVLSLAGCGGKSKKMDEITVSYASIFIKEGVDYNGDKLAKHFLEKFNIKLDPVPVQTTEWREKMNIWISSNDMPDVVVIDYVQMQLDLWNRNCSIDSLMTGRQNGQMLQLPMRIVLSESSSKSCLAAHTL